MNRKVSIISISLVMALGAISPASAHSFGTITAYRDGIARASGFGSVAYASTNATHNVNTYTRDRYNDGHSAYSKGTFYQYTYTGYNPVTKLKYWQWQHVATKQSIRITPAQGQRLLHVSTGLTNRTGQYGTYAGVCIDVAWAPDSCASTSRLTSD